LAENTYLGRTWAVAVVAAVVAAAAAAVAVAVAVAAVSSELRSLPQQNRLLIGQRSAGWSSHPPKGRIQLDALG
jgi:hypothetical protein